jgi:hypothetical protein
MLTCHGVYIEDLMPAYYNGYIEGSILDCYDDYMEDYMPARYIDPSMRGNFNG